MRTYSSAIEKLRQAFVDARSGRAPDIGGIIAAGPQVIPRYGRIFSPSAIPSLTAEEFKSFLQFENNQHWTSINRHVTNITGRMDVLRDTLSFLLDESLPIRSRIDEVLDPSGRHNISGLGKAVVTAILLVSRPDHYPVWNEPAEGAMRTLGIWPIERRGLGFGEKYERIIQLCQRIAGDLGIDLWTLDALWWRVAAGTDSGSQHHYTEEEFENAIRLREELDQTAPLDARREVATRVEQEFIRQRLFRGEKTASCAICGHSFPVDLLRAAHIKRRADCSDAEKRDYTSNVVAMCTLGCDELFERGYIVVLSGQVSRGRRAGLTPAVDDYIARISGRECLAYYRGSGAYFDMHARAVA